VAPFQQYVSATASVSRSPDLHLIFLFPPQHTNINLLLAFPALSARDSDGYYIRMDLFTYNLMYQIWTCINCGVMDNAPDNTETIYQLV
jgi:hypothetical protein